MRVKLARSRPPASWGHHDEVSFLGALQTPRRVCLAKREELMVAHPLQDGAEMQNQWLGCGDNGRWAHALTPFLVRTSRWSKAYVGNATNDEDRLPRARMSSTTSINARLEKQCRVRRVPPVFLFWLTATKGGSPMNLAERVI